MIRKIKAFFNEKQLPIEKKDLIIRTLQNTLITDNINKVNNGETQLKRVFTKIVDDLGIYYKIGLTTDFTGKLFNEMYSWLGFSQDKLNDVVLTPPYIAKLLVRLARVNKDSYVWDFATASAGLLVAAMNEMIADARATIKSPDELQNKIIAIKANQLLGIEVLSSVYMLAILNMILMGDGSSNILNKNSLSDFNGQYGNENDIKIFPADAFVLNPPYSAEGKGMIFVEKALSLMNRGYAAVIVMYSAGNGQAIEYNRNILKHSTLLASIKMPNDIFVGKSAVQTYIYVFRVGEKHKNDNIVKFIDFSNDGYLRSGNKKANKKLKDIDNAIERYDELVNLVLFDKSKLNYFKDYYKEGKINIDSGMDWNQTAKKEKRINFNNYRKTITDYIEWEVANVLVDNQSDVINIIKMPKKIKKFAIGKLFKISRALSMYVDDKLSFTYVDKKDVNAIPLVQQMEHSNGITAYIDRTKLPKRFINKIEKAGQISINPDEKFSYYQEKEFIGNSVVIVDTSSLTKNQALYIVSEIQRLRNDSDYNYKFSKGEVEKAMISLPVDDNGSIDYNYMESFVEKVIIENKRVLNEYSK